jgi:diguanylate cyclase (GGDEF)-like protein
MGKMYLIWIGFSLGFLVSAILVIIYFLIFKRNKKDYFKGFIELAEGTKDWLYYFETKPKWRYKYVFPKLKDPELDRLIYENPHHLLNRVHPDDYEMLIRKINGEVDFSKPILYRLINFQNNEYIWFEEFTTPVYKNGELVAIQGILRNVHEKVKLQAELDYQMSHDSLTGVHNRDFFESNMEKYNNEIDVPVALILCDLDKLKYINDTYGHKVGDIYIKESAKLLSAYSTDDMTISRIGGDEFCFIVQNAKKEVIEDLIEEIRNKVMIYNENNDMEIKISLGYSYSAQSKGQMDNLFVEADTNMYEDKNLRKSISA